VLLVACTNLAHMLLARGTRRQREIAIRVAMGATRGRIVRQLVTESLVLALVGSAAGVLVARWLLPALLRLAPMELPRKDEVGIDPTVLAFALLVAAVTGLLFGVLPAVRASRPDVVETIKSGGGGAGAAGRRGGWGARGALVVSEVALATVLLVGAGLLLKSRWRSASTRARS
jgi:ABC-type antimicrobial peptide transport system permease subunit